MIIEITIVWIIIVIPILIGWFSHIKIIANDNIIKNKIIITVNSLIKILILGINDKWILFTEVLKAILSMIYKIIIFFKLLKLIFILNIFIIFLFFRGVLTFSLTHKHLLMALFSLEFLVLVLFLSFFFFLLHFGFELYILLLYLVFAVCEGALGLGVLVRMVRSHGNDLLSRLSVLSW